MKAFAEAYDRLQDMKLVAKELGTSWEVVFRNLAVLDARYTPKKDADGKNVFNVSYTEKLKALEG
jgi:hypothetical protein